MLGVAAIFFRISNVVRKQTRTIAVRTHGSRPERLILLIGTEGKSPKDTLKRFSLGGQFRCV